MIFNEWIDAKPIFDEECLVICANKIRGEWNYSSYQVRKISFDHTFYWGWLTSDGEEYGDIGDMCAQKYLLIPLLLSENINT